MSGPLQSLDWKKRVGLDNHLIGKKEGGDHKTTHCIPCFLLQLVYHLARWQGVVLIDTHFDRDKSPSLGGGIEDLVKSQ